MYKKILALLMVISLLLAFCSCSKEETKSISDINPNLDTSKDININIVGTWEDFKALELIGNDFTKKYPNCTVTYECLQNYSETIVRRLKDNPETVDIFFSSVVQSDSEYLDYAYNYYSDKRVDFSNTFSGLIDNSIYRNEDSTDTSVKLYSIPMGCEMRGLLVNKTLLSSLNISVPTNVTELLTACKTLSENGYIPLQGNPTNFSQQLLYPYVCNLIINNDDPEGTYNRVNNRASDVSMIFEKPYKLLYTLVENNYYNYKYVEKNDKKFTDCTDEARAKDFLNIVSTDNGFVKADDIGTVAFMPLPLSLVNIVDKTKSDYHSNIDYEFILSPVSDDGGFAYLSLTHSLVTNKNGSNLDWTLEFINFFLEEKNNTKFADAYNVMPNTKNVFDFISEKYGIPENHILHLGEVTFDYAFYNIFLDSFLELSKGNNPKYMNSDATGNPVMYPYDYYFKRMEERFAGTFTE